jgi:hypothetical protein
MPQFTGPLLIKDGSTTPVDVSYAPERLSSEKTVLVDRRLASRDQQPSIEVDFKVPENGSRLWFAIGNTIRYPIVRQVNGIDSVVAVAESTTKYRIPPVMTAQERKHLRALTANAQDNTQLMAGPVDLDPLY